MMPNFLIIGAQKSGSTFFLRCLGDHPDVFMPPEEIRFFEDPEYARSTIADLEKLFSDVTHQTALGIKRPGYLSRPECAERIHHHVPAAKLIVVLRDPVQRAVSAYYHLMKCGFIPVRSLERGLTDILDGKYQAKYPKTAEIVEFGYYHKHLSQYLQYFNRNQLLILLFDSIAADPLTSVSQAYRFIGVRDDYVPAPLQGGRQRNPNPGYYSLTRLRVNDLRNMLMYDYNADRTRRYRKQQPSLINRVVNKLVVSADRLVLSRICGKTKPMLSTELSNRLSAIYAEDVSRLEDLIGQPTGWKRPIAERI